MQFARRNLTLLVCLQALLLTNGVILITVNGLVGQALATHKALATLPVTSYVVGSALTTIPASALMKRRGRRAGFAIGTILGMMGAALCTFAVVRGDFWLLCVATAVLGMYNAFGQYYRFAAADVVSPTFKSKAISLVLAGGIVGGVLGPESAKLTRGLLAVPFAGSYAVLMLLALASLGLVAALRVPPLSQEESQAKGRPLSAIARNPSFLMAVLASMVGYGVMNLLMTATPLAMHAHHHSFERSAFVLESHVVAMFAPAFFTGTLIKKWGALPIIGCGIALMTGCVGVASLGIELMHFWGAMVLLGVGWNFMYVGGTSLLTETYAPSEKAKAQSTHDFCVFAAMVCSSASSGAVFREGGWRPLNLWALPFLLLTGCLGAMVARHRQANPLPATLLETRP